jgi:hypothetical protein
MNDTLWDILPYPYNLIAAPQPIEPGELPDIVRRLLEDATGLAGVIAAAIEHDECDVTDVKYATRYWPNTCMPLWPYGGSGGDRTSLAWRTKTRPPWHHRAPHARGELSREGERLPRSPLQQY